MRSLLAAVLAVLPLLSGTASVPSTASTAPRSTVVFRITDPRIAESSGLVDLGRTMVTLNDSGNAPLLFVLDARTGRTLRTVRFARAAVDTEALAPAGREAVWVGDLGDNLRRRDHVEVLHVPLSGGPVTSYRLAYADGPHDAEALFATADGRLHVVTKDLFGAAFYTAPARLDPRRTNRLHKVATALPIATDAAMFRDGAHVLVRSYGTAAVYAVPSWRPIGSFALPPQHQGESVSVGPGGRIRIGSEGVRSTVLQVGLPARLASRMLPAPPGDDARSSPAPARTAHHDGRPPWWPWAAAGAGVVALVGITGAWRRRTLRP